MTRFAFVLLAGLLLFSSAALAGVADSSASAEVEKISLESQVDIAAAAIDSDGADYARYGARLQLRLEAKLAEKLALGGRFAAYKYWGDFPSAYDDTIRAEQAYLNWRSMAQDRLHLSLGRRPSLYADSKDLSAAGAPIGKAYGAPAELNLDGLSLSYGLNSSTGSSAMKIHLWGGKGIGSEWSNEDLFKDSISAYLTDAWLAGTAIDLSAGDRNRLQLGLFHAAGVTDGVKGIYAFPVQYTDLFAPTLYADMQKFPNFTFAVRDNSTTDIGDISQLGLDFLRRESGGLAWFAGAGLTQLRSNGKAGMFGGLGSDAVYEARLSADQSEIYMVPVRTVSDEVRTGYGVYAGLRVPAPLGKFGLEYNFGSKFWTPISQPDDYLLGNKLVTRGQAAEAYYLFEVGEKTSLRIGGIYYDFNYTGSGSPVGEPQKVSDIKAGAAYSFAPIVDEAWTAYARLSLKF